jgi:hypothetical protein
LQGGRPHDAYRTSRKRVACVLHRRIHTRTYSIEAPSRLSAARGRCRNTSHHCKFDNKAKQAPAARSPSLQAQQQTHRSVTNDICPLQGDEVCWSAQRHCGCRHGSHSRPRGRGRALLTPPAEFIPSSHPSNCVMPTVEQPSAALLCAQSRILTCMCLGLSCLQRPPQ